MSKLDRTDELIDNYGGQGMFSCEFSQLTSE